MTMVARKALFSSVISSDENALFHRYVKEHKECKDLA